MDDAGLSTWLSKISQLHVDLPKHIPKLKTTMPADQLTTLVLDQRETVDCTCINQILDISLDQKRGQTPQHCLFAALYNPVFSPNWTCSFLR